MYLIFTISVIVLILLWAVVRGRRAEVYDVTSAQSAIIPVDLEAFRNLIDPQQERYLRQHLRASEFRRVQRARYMAVAEYLRHVAHNAGVVLQVGTLARDSDESCVRAQGAELMSVAAELRINCLLALTQAYMGVVFPTLSVSAGTVADSYDRVTLKFLAIGRGWKPVRSPG